MLSNFKFFLFLPFNFLETTIRITNFFSKYIRELILQNKSLFTIKLFSILFLI